MKTAEEIRTAFAMKYPDVDDDQFSAKHSRFVHENPMTAIGVVLISSILLGTTEVDRLAEFTKYDNSFIELAVNMENSRLWRDGKYDCAAWSSSSSSCCDGHAVRLRLSQIGIGQLRVGSDPEASGSPM